MRRLLKTLKGLLFPPRCGGCHALMPTAIGKDAPLFCKECATQWERELSHQCPECFAAYPDCRCQPSVLKRAGSLSLVKLAPYREDAGGCVVRTLVLDMKKMPRERAARFLANEIRTALASELEKQECAITDVVLTHIPRDKATRRRTGTDQSQLLARVIARSMSVPHQTLLKRVKRTKTQKKLAAKQRMINLVGAFAVCEAPKGKCVVLVDDVVTTGATTAAAASLLRAAGAAKIITVCVAATQKKKGKA